MRSNAMGIRYNPIYNLSANYYQNQYNRPPIDPIKFDTGTTFKYSRSRVQGKGLGKAIGWAGFGLDLFSGILGGISKLFRLKKGYQHPQVDPRIANQSLYANFSKSSNGNYPNKDLKNSIPDQVWSKFANTLKSIKDQVTKLRDSNEKLIAENEALKKKIEDLSSSDSSVEVDNKDKTKAKVRKVEVDKTKVDEKDTKKHKVEKKPKIEKKPKKIVKEKKIEKKKEKLDVGALLTEINNKASFKENLPDLYIDGLYGIKNLVADQELGVAKDKDGFSERDYYRQLARIAGLGDVPGYMTKKEELDDIKVALMIRYKHDWVDLLKEKEFLRLIPKVEERRKELKFIKDHAPFDLSKDSLPMDFSVGGMYDMVQYKAGQEIPEHFEDLRFLGFHFKKGDKFTEDSLDQIKIALIREYNVGNLEQIFGLKKAHDLVMKIKEEDEKIAELQDKVAKVNKGRDINENPLPSWFAKGDYHVRGFKPGMVVGDHKYGKLTPLVYLLNLGDEIPKDGVVDEKFLDKIKLKLIETYTHDWAKYFGSKEFNRLHKTYFAKDLSS